MKSIIFHAEPEEKNYLVHLKPLLHGRCQTYLDNTRPIMITEFHVKCKQKGTDTVVSTSETLLKLVYPDASNPRISEYAGSLVKRGDTWFLFVPPLEQLFTVPHGKFVFQRFLSKVLDPDSWIKWPTFKWELFQPGRLEALSTAMDTADLVAIDIETPIKDSERRIACVSFTAIRLSGGQIEVTTVVVPAVDLYHILVIRLFCSSPSRKVLQNGKYDIAYLFRYGCPITAYTFDTINLFHSWFCELPKDLGFISAFMVREYEYHKNDGKTGDIYDYYAYNAKDTYTTALGCMALLVEMPEYAVSNYLQEFPVVFPCVLSEHTGLKWNAERAGVLKKRVEADTEKNLGRLRTMVASPGFNPGSWQQTQKLFAILGSKDITNTDVKGRDKVASRHPLNRVLMERITNHRENSKLKGSYFKDSIPWLGRCFYALNPHGTDTGRLASRESQFWCGLQIQNIPNDGDTEEDITVKEAFDAEDDFYFGEADYEQAETRGTGYITGDTGLIEAVEDESKDFHGTNASAFFAIPYHEIVKSVYDDEAAEWIHKTLNKPLRQLSKRTNHGANYNMGAQVMLDTMGIVAVLNARTLLGLSPKMPPHKVTQYLLDRFEMKYPIVKRDYQDWIKNTVANTGILVGATGWTRRCFGVPGKSKQHLNSYVAHNPQSLNAMMLNKAYVKVFQNVYLPNPRDFRLCAQIHDSILFQYRKGREDLAWQVADCMRIPTLVRDIFGISRTLVVPVALKGRGTTWAGVEPLRRVRATEVKAA